MRLNGGLPFTLQESLEMTSLAEERGYEAIWLPEAIGSDALTQLTYLATATRRIRLGTGILPIFYRTPTLLAMSASSLDDISQGRFILGLGVGHQRFVEYAHGVPFGRPITRMRETVEIVRRLLRGERFTHKGRVFNTQDSGLGVTPARPDIPIYLAALGPRMIELAGEVADGVILIWASPGYIRRAMEHLRRGAERASRNPDDIDVACYLSVAVVDDGLNIPEQVLPALQQEIARYSSMPFYKSYFEQSGFKEEADAVAQALERGDAGAAAAAISDTMQRELGIFGTAEQCRQEVEARRALGVKLPVIAPLAVGADPIGSFRATIEAFSG
jgi:probable F420-dependent oxidoreductase